MCGRPAEMSGAGRFQQAQELTVVPSGVGLPSLGVIEMWPSLLYMTAQYLCSTSDMSAGDRLQSLTVPPSVPRRVFLRRAEAKNRWWPAPVGHSRCVQNLKSSSAACPRECSNVTKKTGLHLESQTTHTHPATHLTGGCGSRAQRSLSRRAHTSMEVGTYLRLSEYISLHLGTGSANPRHAERLGRCCRAAAA